MKFKYSHGLVCMVAGVLGLLTNSAARADTIFVGNYSTGTIGEYTTSGATVNASLISGLSVPEGIAVSGSDLFVTTSNTVSEYTISGATVNAALISVFTELTSAQSGTLLALTVPALLIPMLVWYGSLRRRTAAI